MEKYCVLGYGKIHCFLRDRQFSTLTIHFNIEGSCQCWHSMLRSNGKVKINVEVLQACEKRLKQEESQEEQQTQKGAKQIWLKF